MKKKNVIQRLIAKLHFRRIGHTLKIQQHKQKQFYLIGKSGGIRVQYLRILRQYKKIKSGFATEIVNIIIRGQTYRHNMVLIKRQAL